MWRPTGLAVIIGLTLARFGAALVAQDGGTPITAGGMTVTVPCTAEWNTTTQDVPEEAAVVTTNVLACQAEGALYVISWSEVVTKNQFDGMAALRSGRDAMVRQAGAVLVKSADIVHDGLRGIEFTADWRGGLLSSRGVFRGKRIYSVSIGTPAGVDRSADIKRLLSSLKIAR